MAMFENFPYTDLHNLNLDWIIKIAKDFLDQYTHIQQLIEDGEQSLQDLTSDGLQQLQEKADNLEDLLQAWYDTHSQDIADQLADALADLNEWYTTHQNYLDDTLTSKTAFFNERADEKTAQCLASIPADYSTLGAEVQNMIDNDRYHSEKYYSYKNLLLYPNMNDPTYTELTTPIRAVTGDECNIIELTNSGSTVRYVINLIDELPANSTVYYSYDAYSESDGTSLTISYHNSSNISRKYLKSGWNHYSGIMQVELATSLFDIKWGTLGTAKITNLVLSTEPITYDYSLKQEIKQIDITNFVKNLNELYIPQYADYTLSVSNGYMQVEGTITEVSGTHHAAISVNKGDILILSSQHGLDMKMYVFKNAFGTIDYYPYSRVQTTNETVQFTATEDGTLYLNGFNTPAMKAKRLAGYNLNTVNNKSWCAIGDSITDQTVSYVEILASKYGYTATNMGTSGMGYMKPINSKTFVDKSQLATVYDIVTVFGSVNDMQYISDIGTESDTGTDTLAGCFNTVITNLINSGNYHIGIISPIPNNTQNANPANPNGTFATYCDMLERVCKRRGVPFLNLWKCSNMQPWDETFRNAFMPDGTHPNAAGAAIFAPRIKAFIDSL